MKTRNKKRGVWTGQRTSQQHQQQQQRLRFLIEASKQKESLVSLWWLSSQLYTVYNELAARNNKMNAGDSTIVNPAPVNSTMKRKEQQHASANPSGGGGDDVSERSFDEQGLNGFDFDEKLFEDRKKETPIFRGQTAKTLYFLEVLKDVEKLWSIGGLEIHSAISHTWQIACGPISMVPSRFSVTTTTSSLPKMKVI